MKNIAFFLALCFAFTTVGVRASTSDPKAIAANGGTNDAVDLSLSLLRSAKDHSDPAALQKKLSSYSVEELKGLLPNDAYKLAFWINVYNASVVLALQKDAGQYADRGAFFAKKQINVAGHELSLDDIEHGMIRHSRIKLSYGYFGDPFPGKFERTFRVKDLDFRVHFALNCGAKSCPQVASYHADGIYAELQESMELHMKKFAKYDKEPGTVGVPAFMGWFRADFHGKKGIRKITQDLGIVPKNAKPDVAFSDYDWTMDIDNFR
ncbi:MAG: DUF547 domain-containing protein [Flavobacteriales bacterium]